MRGIAVTCDAERVLAGSTGERVVPAADFFVGALSTVLADDELILEIRLPPWPQKRRWTFEEFSMRHGDFALAGIAAFYDPDDAGRATNTHIGVIGACRRPQRLRQAEAALDGRIVDAAAIGAAGDAAMAAVEPPEDLHASAAYRRSLVGTLLERALLRASQ